MLKGIYPPLITPFVNDEVAYELLEDNVNKYNKSNLAGYVVFGSNGESVFLSDEEKIRLIATVREHTPKGKSVIAGTGLESIRETIKLSNEAAKNGADYALIITPYFFKNGMTHNALVEYYTVVADSIHIPVIIYNVTKFTNLNIAIETVLKLSEHPNIIGIKDSSENIAQVSETIYSTKKNFTTLIGTGSVLLPALQSGAAGGVLALANIAPAECVKIFELFNDGKIIQAQKIQNRMLAINKAITATYGVAGLKSAMDLLGYYGGRPRKPLQPLTSIQVKELKSILKKANLLK
jgi:4-hydroxy-2-oxoglutarate aldolase